MRFRDRFDRSKRKASTRNQRIGFAFFWLIVLFHAYVIPTSPSFNTESHLYVAFSLVDHHTVNIDGFRRRLGDESFTRGHYYSDKAPGLSFLAVPVYALLKVAFPAHKPAQYDAIGKHQFSIPRDTVYLRYAITYLLVIIPSAIFAVLLWLFLCQFVASGWALAVSGVYSVGTTSSRYSMWFFSHQVAAMLLFGAFLILFYRVRNNPRSYRGLVDTALAGLLAGYAVISEYPTIAIAALLGIYLLAISQRRLLSALAFTAGALPAAILAMTYNVLAFGKPLSTGYMYVNSAMYRHHVQPGIFGFGGLSDYGIQMPSLNSLWEITFGPYRGIFLVSPVLLVFFAGIKRMLGRRDLRPEAWLCLSAVVVYFLMDASRAQDLNGWAGGSSIASRHLVPMLPFMMVPMVFALRHRIHKVLFLILGAVSVAIASLIAAVVDSDGFPIGDPNPLINVVWDNLLHGKTSVNWGYMTGMPGFETYITFVIVAAALLFRIDRLFRGARSAVQGHEPTVLAAEAT